MVWYAMSYYTIHSRADYDDRMRSDLVQLMGEARVKYWPLIDMYLFAEEMDDVAL